MASKARKRKSRKQKKKNGEEKKKKLTLKRALRAAARMIYKHLVKLPEEERERNIAALERAVAKKFKREKGTK
jgi:hypothetical protein